ELAANSLPEDLHQSVDLAGRPKPVLGREGIADQRTDVEVDRRLDGTEERARAFTMPGLDGHPFARRPPGGAVHDDGDGVRPLTELDGRFPPAEDAGQQPAAGHLNLRDLGFFALQEVVDLLDVLVGELLNALLGAMFVVRANALFFLQVVDHVTAYIPHRDPPVLGDLPRDLDELLAPLLGQLRDWEANQFSVVRRIEAEVRLLDRPANSFDGVGANRLD